MKSCFIIFSTFFLSWGIGYSKENVAQKTISNKQKDFEPFMSKSAEEKPYRPPVLATSAIIEVYNGDVFKGIVVIDRWNKPFGKALPGGKVEYGESIENALKREMKEELNIEIEDLKQFHVYSDPHRDPRFHCVDVLFIAKAKFFPKAGDDAAKAWVVTLDELKKLNLAFDHKEMIQDYMNYKSKLLEESKSPCPQKILLPCK